MKNSIFELSPEALEGLFGTEVDDEQLRQNAEIYKEEILKEIQSGSKQRVIDLLKLSRTLSDFDQLRIFFAFGDRK